MPGDAPGRQVWRSVEVDLVWERGDWRIDGWATRKGPTPALTTGALASTGDDLLGEAHWPNASNRAIGANR
jgi:hypothetical protein